MRVSGVAESASHSRVPDWRVPSLSESEISIVRAVGGGCENSCDVVGAGLVCMDGHRLITNALRTRGKKRIIGLMPMGSCISVLAFRLAT